MLTIVTTIVFYVVARWWYFNRSGDCCYFYLLWSCNVAISRIHWDYDVRSRKHSSISFILLIWWYIFTRCDSSWNLFQVGTSWLLFYSGNADPDSVYGFNELWTIRATAPQTINKIKKKIKKKRRLLHKLYITSQQLLHHFDGSRLLAEGISFGLRIGDVYSLSSCDRFLKLQFIHSSEIIHQFNNCFVFIGLSSRQDNWFGCTVHHWRLVTTMRVQPLQSSCILMWYRDVGCLKQ